MSILVRTINFFDSISGKTFQMSPNDGVAEVMSQGPDSDLKVNGDGNSFVVYDTIMPGGLKFSMTSSDPSYINFFNQREANGGTLLGTVQIIYSDGRIKSLTNAVIKGSLSYKPNSTVDIEIVGSNSI
jgi:hypothetical protein